MGEERKQWSGDEILAILKRHLVDKGRPSGSGLD
jgi:hypothetical protein